VIETSYGPVDPAFCHPVLREEIALLGGADPFASQRGLVGRIKTRLVDMPDDALDHRPGPGEWSTREVIGHLIHSEMIYGYRYRAIAAEPECTLPGIDQNRWVDALPESRWPIERMLGHLESLKELNVAMLEALPVDARLRWGNHSERGPESLAALIGAIAGHDLLHEAQIDANLESWRRSAASR
jgi:hypothetical protein